MDHKINEEDLVIHPFCSSFEKALAVFLGEMWSVDRPLPLEPLGSSQQMLDSRWVLIKVEASKMSPMLIYDEASLLQSIAHGAGRNCLGGNGSDLSILPSSFTDTSL